MPNSTNPPLTKFQRLEEIIKLPSRTKLFCSTHPVNFFTVRLAYLIIASFVGAAIIAVYENILFVDGLFLSVSAITGTGLFTVSMLDISAVSFVILAILMFFGSIFFLLIPPLIARQYYNRKVREEYKDMLEEIPAEIIQEHDELNEALIAAIWVMLSYLLLWHLICSLIIYGALFLQPHEPELELRNYGRYANALFLTISSFANAGFALSSSSIFYWKDNPLAYFVLSLVILAGNTAIPCILYAEIKCIIYLREYLGWDTSAYVYILEKPNQITSHILPLKTTELLGISILAFNCIEYVFFLGSTLIYKPALDQYGGANMLAGIGYFQSISTRTAGLQIMDLRFVNQGMLIVYVIMMYFSSFPFLGTLMATAIVFPTGNTTSRFIGSVIGRHSFFIFLSFLMIGFIENDLVDTKHEVVDLWYIFFECVSAYANVGLSLSLPGHSYSLSGEFTSYSKVIIIFLMMLGKHRLLPNIKEPFIHVDYSDFHKKIKLNLTTSDIMNGTVVGQSNYHGCQDGDEVNSDASYGVSGRLSSESTVTTLSMATKKDIGITVKRAHTTSKMKIPGRAAALESLNAARAIDV